MSGPLAIIPVVTPAELDRFIRVPMRLNKDDPNWVSPLVFERKEALSAKHNPFFEHADVQFWLATRDGRDVGRISAQIDHLAREDPAQPAGHFGMIAAEDDEEVFKALFATAEAWLKARGKVKALGPFNLSVNEESGLLVEGFDTPPMLMMGHDPAYTAKRIEALGYVKAKDLWAYWVDFPAFPPRIRKRLDRPLSAGVTMRQADMSKFDEEVRTLVDIYNDAWSENWGSVPVTPAETKHMADSLRLILNPKLIWFMDIDGEPAAFILMLPNLNSAIHDIDGRLLPFGWAKLVWRLKVKGVTLGRVPLMGVKKKFAHDVRGAMAPFQLIDAVRREGSKVGINTAELSWILEDNRAIGRILESIGGYVYKTYRIYERTIG